MYSSEAFSVHDKIVATASHPASPSIFTSQKSQGLRLSHTAKIEGSDERSEDEKSMKCYVYILRCADDSLYVGCTNNLDRRLKQHNESKYGAHYTKIRRPVSLIYAECHNTLRQARRREAEIKGWRREKKLMLVESRNAV